MSKITWEPLVASSGVERVVLYPATEDGVPWNGVVSIETGGSEGATTLYFDGQAFLIATDREEYRATVEAITYPGVLDQLSGQEGPVSGQDRRLFHLSYRETLTDGYILHLVWNATATPSSKTSKTRSNDVELDTFAWDISTKPENLDGLQPSAHFTLDSNAANPAALALLEDILTGTESTPATMPSPAEALEAVQLYPFVKVTDNGDGTWTAEGDSEYIRYLTATEVEVVSGGIRFVDENTYTIQSW